MARMGNNAAAAAFAAEQERIQAEQLAAQLRSPAVAGPTSASVTLTPEEVADWETKRYDIPALGTGHYLDSLYDATTKIPGSPTAIYEGLKAGIDGDMSWNPYGGDRSVWDYMSGGSQLSQDENARDIGRTIGTIALGGTALGAMGGEAAGAGLSEAAATGGGDLMGLGGTYVGPGFEFGGELANAGIGIGGTGSGATFGGGLGGLEGAMAGLGEAALGGYTTPPGDFMGPSEYGPPGTPDAPVDLPPGTPPSSESIDITGQRPPTGGVPPMIMPPTGGVPPTTITEPPGPTTVTEPPPKTGPNYGKLLSSLLGNLLSSGGGSGGGSGGYGGSGSSGADKLARSLRQPSEPVTMTNPNYIPR